MHAGTKEKGLKRNEIVNRGKRYRCRRKTILLVVRKAKPTLGEEVLGRKRKKTEGFPGASLEREQRPASVY